MLSPHGLSCLTAAGLAATIAGGLTLAAAGNWPIALLAAISTGLGFLEVLIRFTCGNEE